MKTVRIDQLTLGSLEPTPKGWVYNSEHPATALLNGKTFKTEEDVKNLLADECISPALDLFMQLIGSYTNVRYSIKIQ